MPVKACECAPCERPSGAVASLAHAERQAVARSNEDMARRSTLRASDADRERIAEQLRHATAEGRLLAEELEERLEATFGARTYGELDAVVADLPGAAVHRRERPARATWLRPLPILALIIFAPLLFSLLLAAAVVIAMLFSSWVVVLV